MPTTTLTATVTVTVLPADGQTPDDAKTEMLEHLTQHLATFLEDYGAHETIPDDGPIPYAALAEALHGHPGPYALTLTTTAA